MSEIMSKSILLCRDGNIVAVDSVTPTLFVISEGGDLLRWLVLILDFVSQIFQIFSSFSSFCVCRFDCADYMREPSDIAVGGREFYVCDFKVTFHLCIWQSHLRSYPNIQPKIKLSLQGHNVVVFTEEGVFVRRIG